MDFDQLKKWMEMAKKQQSEDFWKLFSDSSMMNDFLNSGIRNGSPTDSAHQSKHSTTFPPVDIYMTELEIIVLADLAGFKKDNLNVSVSGTNLLLKGTFPSLIPVKPIHQERLSGDFERIVELPEPARSSDIRAKFENGLLMVWYKRNRPPEEAVKIE